MREAKSSSHGKSKKPKTRIFAVTLFLNVMTAPNLVFAEDSIAAGKLVFERKCSGCHEVGPDAGNGVGPILNNLFGRKAGTAPGFKYYSESNANALFIWNEDNFKKFIENPKSMIAATKQLFNGLKNKKEIDDITIYLKTFSKQ